MQTRILHDLTMIFFNFYLKNLSHILLFPAINKAVSPDPGESLLCVHCYSSGTSVAFCCRCAEYCVFSVFIRLARYFHSCCFARLTCRCEQAFFSPIYARQRLVAPACILYIDTRNVYIPIYTFSIFVYTYLYCIHVLHVHDVPSEINCD